MIFVQAGKKQCKNIKKCGSRIPNGTRAGGRNV